MADVLRSGTWVTIASCTEGLRAPSPGPSGLVPRHGGVRGSQRSSLCSALNGGPGRGMVTHMERTRSSRPEGARGFSCTTSLGAAGNSASPSRTIGDCGDPSCILPSLPLQRVSGDSTRARPRAFCWGGMLGYGYAITSRRVGQHCCGVHREVAPVWLTDAGCKSPGDLRPGIDDVLRRSRGGWGTPTERSTDDMM